MRKEHYAYEKCGSCALVASVEPLTGRRLAQVHRQRTRREYTLFCLEMASFYPDAIKIRTVEDNLNTHNSSSFYAHLPADEAFALAQRFEFYYTPKSASWLNMIEIEFSALAHQCLHRRIPTQERLAQEVLTLVKERNDMGILLNWQFSIAAARSKLNSHYIRLLPDNQEYLIT